MTPGVPAFVEVAPAVYVLRHPVLDVNVTLVVGGEVALVVDTLSTTAQATQLLDAVRQLTDLPLAVVNTHGHFDHCFGNAVLARAVPGTSIWAHQSTVDEMRGHEARVRRAAIEEAFAVDPAFADEVGATELLAPDRVIDADSTMDIGGRTVRLRHFGRGHTDGDVVVFVPDADLVVAGDLVEEGAPPSFVDCFPLDWPETLAAMLEQVGPSTAVVPGHGAVVGTAFARAQQEELTRLEWLIRDGDRDEVPAETVAAAAPFGREAALVAVRRGYAELSGRA